MKIPRQNSQLKLCSGTQIKFSGMIITIEGKGNFLPQSNISYWGNVNLLSTVVFFDIKMVFPKFLGH